MGRREEGIRVDGLRVYVLPCMGVSRRGCSGSARGGGGRVATQRPRRDVQHRMAMDGRRGRACVGVWQRSAVLFSLYFVRLRRSSHRWRRTSEVAIQ